MTLPVRAPGLRSGADAIAAFGGATKLSSLSLEVVTFEPGTCQVRAGACQARTNKMSSSSLAVVKFKPGSCQVRAWKLSGLRLEPVCVVLGSWPVQRAPPCTAALPKRTLSLSHFRLGPAMAPKRTPRKRPAAAEVGRRSTSRHRERHYVHSCVRTTAPRTCAAVSYTHLTLPTKRIV